MKQAGQTLDQPMVREDEHVRCWKSDGFIDVWGCVNSVNTYIQSVERQIRKRADNIDIEGDLRVGHGVFLLL